MTDDDRLERALRVPGPREAGYEPRVLPASLDGAGRSRGAAAGVLRASLLVAGAVAAAALTFAVVSRLPANGTPQGAGSSASGAASPTEAPPACEASNLAVSTDPWGGAAGSRGTTVLFRTLSSAGRCQVQGAPAAEIADAGGSVFVRSPAASGGAPVVLGPGVVAEVNVSWSNWCGVPATPRYLVLDLSGSVIRLPIAGLGGETLAPPGCNGPGQASRLNVLPFAASDRVFPGG